MDKEIKKKAFLMSKKKIRLSKNIQSDLKDNKIDVFGN